MKTCFPRLLEPSNKDKEYFMAGTLKGDPTQDNLVCYTAVFSVVTQCSSPLQWGGALRDDTKNGCVAD